MSAALLWRLLPYVALAAAAAVPLAAIALGVRRRALVRRPVLLVALLGSALPGAYMAAVWARLLPEAYLRMGHPLAAPLALLAMTPVAFWLARHRARFGAWRRVLSDLLVSTAVLSAALAVTEPELGRPLDRLTVVVVVDRSRSINLVPHAAERISRELRAAESDMRTHDLIGTVAFAARAFAEQPPHPKSELAGAERIDVGRDGTDIAAGLERALAEVPADSAARLVLVSDGVATRGDVLAAAAAAMASDIPIDSVLLEQREVPDVRVVSFRLPARASEGENIDLRVVVGSPRGTEIELRLERDGKLVRRAKAKVAAGEDVLRLRLPAPSSGLHRYDVHLTALEHGIDFSAEDNQATAFIRVRGPARALVLDGDPGATTFVAGALEAAGFVVEQGSVSGVPADIGAMAQHDLIVFGDIAARELRPAQIEALASWVRDLGGGLLLMGGDRSMGPGGYARSPLEEVSPVSFDLKQDRRRASLAEVIAIDISGSMGAHVGGHTKLELANEAAARSAKLLGGGDELGVMHVDTAVTWSVPLGPVRDKKAIESAIRAVSPGGGGIVVSVTMPEAYAALDGALVNLKHVLLFADGADAEQVTPAVQAAVSYAHARGITTSCVALGKGGDVPALEEMSRRGGGRFYIVEDATRLPAIFAEETILASRSAVVEEPFQVAVVGGGAIGRGIDWSEAPPLEGYVVTLPKPRATVLLSGPESDPVLAHWSVGIGRAAVFTSDLKDRWGGAWTHWPGAARMVAQAARALSRRQDDERVRLVAQIAAGQLRLRATAVDDDGRLQSFRRLRATVRGPGGFAREVSLEPAAAGSYRAEVPLARPGAYIAVARDELSGEALGTTGAALSIGEELRPTGSDGALLARIAELTGGKRRDTLAGIFRDRAARRFAYRLITDVLLWVAAFALLLAVAARRLSLPEWLLALPGRALRWRPWSHHPEGEPAPGGASAEATLGQLLARKQHGDPQPPARDHAPAGSTGATVGGRAATAAAHPPTAPQPPSAPTAWPAPPPAPPAAAAGAARPRWPARPDRPHAPSTATGAEPPPASRPLTAAEILLERRRRRR